MRERLEGLVKEWRTEAWDLNFRFRDQSPSQTMKVDVLQGCAAALERVVKECGEPQMGADGEGGS